MEYTAFKEAVAQKAQAMGIAEYELYYQAGESVSVSVFAHEIDRFSAHTEGGVCFRCIVNGKMGYASTQELSREQAEAIVIRAADNAAALESKEPVFLNPGGMTYRDVKPEEYPLPDVEGLITAALDTQEKLYAADPAVTDGSTTQALVERTTVAITNSKGLDLYYTGAISGLVVAAVVEQAEEKANEYRIELGDLNSLDRTALAEKAVHAALQKLGGQVPPTANCPVIFDPEAMSDLLSVFAGIFSSENAQKGLSQLAGKEGEVIASPAVTLVDDPFHPQNPVPMGFDSEGSPTYEKKIIEKGVLKTLLYNLKTAAVAGKTTTGNASKANYDSAVAVRPFTMYLAAGQHTEQELLRMAGNGVYITP